MNYYTYILRGLLACTLCNLIWSCTTDFEEINQNKKEPSQVDAKYLVANAQSSLMVHYLVLDARTNANALLSQHFGQIAYTQESRYQLSPNFYNRYWSEYYTKGLKDLAEAQKLIEAAPEGYLSKEEKNNRLAIVKTLQVWGFQLVTDAYGDIPYFNALSGETIPNPAYDTQEEIYKDLVAKITEAITLIQPNSGAFESYDLVYNSDMYKWKKFAASLKLRLGMRIMDVAPELGKKTVEEAIQAGVFTSNTDNALFQFLEVPNANPVYTQYIDRQEYGLSNTFIDMLKDLDDPRIHKYAGYAWNEADGAYNIYAGVPFGQSQNMNYWLASRPHNDIQKNPSQPGVFMDYAQVAFLLAEAAELNIAVGGTAAEHYHAGIRASMEYWGVEESNINAYLSQDDVNYANAPGDYKQKIGTQKWLALYLQEGEAWAEWRRLDYPILNVPVDGNLTYEDIPKRLKYPDNEKTVNAANVEKAIQNIGSDQHSHKLWWDIH
ncbi:SusD/RagB family nutrient-binding outer membrane lipoprotein [Rapidithrix thailandica]|uniref:SusD/RagB family nutrient-binding outer membrane lipoprotein n=1 Tax=Rapidithrix thailandica TaxID=413964 RepID=A0AAW9RZ98_9BACT